MWGLLTIYWKQLHQFDPFELIAWRVTMSAAVMIAVLTIWRRWRIMLPGLRASGVRLRVLLSALAVLVNWTVYVWAVVHGHVLETALGYFIAPLSTIAVGVFVVGETLTPARRIAVGLGLIAVIILGFSVGRVPWVALGIAGSWTSYGFLKRTIPLNAVDGMAAEVFLLLTPAVVLIGLMSPRSASVVNSASTGQMIVLSMAGFATVIPLTMFSYAAQRVPMTVLAPTQYVVPSINFLLGWLAYHEPLNAARVVGFALIWVALALITAETIVRSPAFRRSRAMGTSG